MENENLHEEAKPKEGEADEQKTAADNLRFMRSVIEKTNLAFKPGAPVMIVWGLIFMTGYPATQYFLAATELHDFIQPMWIVLWVIGASVGMFYGFIGEIRERQVGLISRISKQIGLIWYILLLNGTVWSGLVLFKVSFGNPAFLWAALFGIGLSVSGILSSKEWLFGGIAIFIAILAATFIKAHTYIILGIVMGLACIIPAIIVQRNYNKQKEENAQA
jgi:hypothetical protein